MLDAVSKEFPFGKRVARRTTEGAEETR